MSGGSSSGGASPNINVTPLIDVLLVLLIIFMIIAPSKPSRFKAQVPAEPKPEEQTQAKPNPLTLVVAVGSDGKVTLNNEEAGDVADASLLTNKLAEQFGIREKNGTFREGTNEVEKTVFMKAPKSVPYGNVVRIIDAVKSAGAEPIGLQIDDLQE
jgi:biopolymer transport protein ExbD